MFQSERLSFVLATFHQCFESLYGGFVLIQPLSIPFISAWVRKLCQSFLLLVSLSIPVNSVLFCQSLDVRDFGAKVDGHSDDYSALKAALAAAIPESQIVQLPTGSIYVDFRNRPPLLMSHGVHLRGQGRDSKIVTNHQAPTIDETLFLVTSGDSASFSDMAIIGPDSMGAITTKAIAHLGGIGGRMTISNVLISGFSNGIKSQEGNTTIEIVGSEIANCGMGVLFPGRIQGLIEVSGTTIHDTRPQTLSMPPTFFHGIYAYRQHKVIVRDCSFYRISGYGIHLWDGDTTEAALNAPHSISNTDFRDMFAGFLAGSKRGTWDSLVSCTFDSCRRAIKLQEGNLFLRSCKIQSLPGIECTGVAPQNDHPGDLVAVSTIFNNPSSDSSAVSIAMIAKSASKWSFDSCSFLGGSGVLGTAIDLNAPSASMEVKHSQFMGEFSTSSVLSEDGELRVESCEFDTPNDAIYVRPRPGASTSIVLNGNTILNSHSFLRIWVPSPEAQISIAGGNNLVFRGLEFWDCPDSALVRNYTISNRLGEGEATPVTPHLVLSRNFDTWHLTGSGTISTIAMAGIYHRTEYGACNAKLIVDSMLTLTDAGNIQPANLARRLRGDTITLSYDIIRTLWSEVAPHIASIKQEDDSNPPSKTPVVVFFANYPNPFNLATTITYSLSERSPIKLSIVDPLGRTVSQLLDVVEDRGPHVFTWNAGSIPSGLYFARIQTPSFIEVISLLLVK
jgi:hypothetical protein